MEIKIDLTTNEQKDLKSYCKLNELDETERGDGGFGSSGK